MIQLSLLWLDLGDIVFVWCFRLVKIVVNDNPTWLSCPYCALAVGGGIVLQPWIQSGMWIRLFVVKSVRWTSHVALGNTRNICSSCFKEGYLFSRRDTCFGVSSPGPLTIGIAAFFSLGLGASILYLSVCLFGLIPVYPPTHSYRGRQTRQTWGVRSKLVHPATQPTTKAQSTYNQGQQHHANQARHESNIHSTRKQEVRENISSLEVPVHGGFVASS